MTTEFDGQGYIDVSEVTDRIDELRSERDTFTITDNDGGEHEAPDEWAGLNPDDAEELAELEALTDELRGNGGGHQWEGNWYPAQLIADHEFTDYTENLANDLGAVDSNNANWIVIDWEATARNVQQDYTSSSFAGTDYWYR